MVLWIVNVALLLLAGVVTAWVLGQVPSLSVGEAKGDPKPARADRKAEHKGGAGEADEAVVPQGLASVEDADTLWQQTLFRPERTEDITQPAAEEVAAGAVAVDLELVGLARIGERFVAVIVSYRGQPRRAAPGAPGMAPTARRGAAARAAAAAPAGPGAEAVPEGPPDRHVYKVGDKIGESGYVLKEIRLKEKEAVLARGSEERVLKLDATDEQSSGRREVAVTQATQAAQVAAAQAAQAAAQAAAKPAAEGLPPGAPKPPAEVGAAPAAPPLPPPPPVAAGAPTVPGAPGAAVPAVPGAGAVNSDGAPVVPMSREDRLERARLLRERILQGRPPTNSTN
jgi:hypothetical protein